MIFNLFFGLKSFNMQYSYVYVKFSHAKSLQNIWKRKVPTENKPIQK